MAETNPISVAVPLTQGGCAIIDPADWPKVRGFRWFVSNTGYVRAAFGKDSYFLLHRMLTGAPHGVFVDHKNGDKLDNRRDNLRLCSHAENMCNRRRVSGRSPYKGVVVRRYDKTGTVTFRAQITKNGKTIKLGTFKTAALAALEYDRAAVELHGSFACTNRDLGLL